MKGAHLKNGHDKGPVRCPHPRTRVRRCAVEIEVVVGERKERMVRLFHNLKPPVIQLRAPSLTFFVGG